MAIRGTSVLGILKKAVNSLTKKNLNISEHPNGCRVAIYLSPRASRNKITGFHDGALKIAIQAPPVDNAANEALILFLADTFDLSRRSVQIVSGLSSRRKTVMLEGLAKNALLTILKKQGLEL